MNEAELNQSDLITNVQTKNCDKSYKFLLKQYEPLIKSLASNFCSKYKNTPIEIEDIKNILNFNFYILVKNFDETKGKFFPSYIKEFLFYKTSTYMKQYLSNKYITLNFYVDFEEEIIDANINTRNYELEILEYIKNIKTLTNLELNVFKKIQEGWTINEIAVILNKNTKTLYAAKKRAINKIRKNLNT